MATSEIHTKQDKAHARNDALASIPPLEQPDAFVETLRMVVNPRQDRWRMP